jgi:hypothetical protein
VTLIPRKGPHREWWVIAILFVGVPIAVIVLRALWDAAWR